MNAERRITLPETDHQRLEMLLGALPELQVHELYERLATTGILSEAHQEMLEDYFLRIGRSAVFFFDSERTQEGFERFNAAATALDDYMSDHFAPVPMRGATSFHLYPDYKRGNEEQHAFWLEKFKELEALALEFIKTYQELLATAVREVSGGRKTAKTISLQGAMVKFDDVIPAILVGAVRCALPPFKNEHFLCRVMFAHRVGEAVDWSTVYEEMESGGAASKGAGQTTKSAAQQEQAVKDAVHALNERVQGVIGTTDQILTWSKKTIRRNF